MVRAANGLIIISLLIGSAIAGVWYRGDISFKILGKSYTIETKPNTITLNAFVVKSSDGIDNPNSISAEKIDSILAEYQSPAANTGNVWIELGDKYKIDAAYALAFFIHESSAGTASAWAGWKSDGGNTHNIGNIICAGYETCYGRFRDYADWRAGIEDWFRLIRVEYIDGRGLHTVSEIIPVYAPSVENDVQAYVDTVNSLVQSWRGTNDTGDTNDIRAKVIKTALAQLGKPYVYGATGSDAFDCSSFVEYVYSTVGVETTRTTFTQLDRLRSIERSEVKSGDMVYFQYPWDQHVGILADTNGDGLLDMIHASDPTKGVIITNNVFNDSFFSDAIIGYRRALGD